MTISSQTRKAGPYSGTGSTGPFTFSFKVFEASDLLVVKVNNSTSVETTLTLTTDYTVSLNADQNANPGGTVTLTAALAVGYNMVIVSQVPYLQETDLTNQGGFYPEVITDALDKLTIETQQLKLDVDRSAKLPITSQADADALVADIQRLALSADNVDAVATNISNVNTVATNSSNISTVSNAIAAVNSVSTSISSVNAVAPSIANVNSVAGIASSVNTVASNSTNVSTVAGISSSVTTVAGISSAVTTVATNVVDVTNFSAVYYGPSANDPTTRHNGSALQTGDLYFNTTSSKMRSYTSTGWIDVGTPIPVTITAQTFSGNASTTVFTLSTAPSFGSGVDVYISGVAQRMTTDFTVSGTTLTFVSAPPSGTNNIYVKIVSAYAGGVPNDDSVTTAKITNSAVTTAKISDGAVTTIKIADANITTAKIADSNVTTAKIADANITTGKVADSAIATAKIADSAITTVKVADASITGAKLAAGAARSNFGAGAVLQVVQTTDGTQYSTTSGTAVRGSQIVSITPSSTSSKILVMANFVEWKNNTYHRIYLFRNSTEMQRCDTIEFNGSETMALTYYDSPATTSSVSYAIYHSILGGTGPGILNPNGPYGPPSMATSITLMEIAG